ncbi:DUF4279 domain-containing protein [Ureibacillus sp. 179-F W5.1 NHS]|uniref:DUF4279 domain-containing protein n=1 Tax=Lysinibacillus halotolerans TaxID=1368476 RepID=A0A3M8H513_9BACI|nr:DUF4279 domain-containing protein [Lysinibacillus halotolerans]
MRKHYKERYSLGVFIRIYFEFIDAQTPGIHLNKKIIQFANNIGVDIEVFIDNEVEKVKR